MTRKQILNGCELCDLHVNAFQNLVKKSFPHVGGLQNTLLQSTYAIDGTGKPIIQILHVRNSHWATLCVDGDDICLYDSAYSSVSEDAIATIAQLIRVTESSFNIKIMNIAKQCGSADCALYSMGGDPTQVVYNQLDMRPHLVMCFESKILSAFPTLKHRKPASKVIRIEKCKIYCYCRMPDDHKEMVQCDKCGEWFHCHCVNDYDTNLDWFCLGCATQRSNNV